MDVFLTAYRLYKQNNYQLKKVDDTLACLMSQKIVLTNDISSTNDFLV